MNPLVSIERDVYQKLIKQGMSTKDADIKIKAMSINEMIKFLDTSE